MAEWKLMRSLIYHLTRKRAVAAGKSEAEAIASAKTTELEPRFIRGEDILTQLREGEDVE